LESRLKQEIAQMTRPTRRTFCKVSGFAAAGVLISAAGGICLAADTITRSKPAHGLAPDEILRKLLAGNKRFTQGTAVSPRRKPDDFSQLVEGQNPLAVVIGCSDSRVSPELLFDQGVGDLFVVRVAGNVVNGAGAVVKGSIEYAVAELGVSLVVVLGHSQCGAVKSAIAHIDARDTLPGAINELVNFIKPAVLKAKGQPGDPLDAAIRANVEIGVERLKGLAPILAGPVKQGRVKVVGGVYDLRSGGVTIVA
jgi:carbonic anhydrase